MTSSKLRPVRLLSPLRDFLRTEAAGGVLLVGAATLALAWANSPWNDSYRLLWDTKLALKLGGVSLDWTLQHWINDALMSLFFFVVGLEIKRELSSGHLSTRRTATLPAIAAVGGMIVPAVVFLAIAGSTSPRGWAIPVATDIALAVGVVTLVRSAVSPALRAFLLGLAIVDDIGAILIIALVYSSGVDGGRLLIALGAIALCAIVHRLQAVPDALVIPFAIVAWYSFYKAGIHPTIAGVVVGLLHPNTPHHASNMVDIEEIPEAETSTQEQAAAVLRGHSVSKVEWLEHVLHPWTSFVVAPLFALANAGVAVSSDGLGDMLTSPLAWGIIAGMVVGKPLGIVAVVQIAKRLKVADMPTDSTVHSRLGVGVAAGIGFTVALFIAELAFTDAAQRDQAKLAVLCASVLAGVLAFATLRVAGRQRAST
jgi:NhaA family Na+:H+ antiporter